MNESAQFFSQTIINWYKQHKRDLPWRNSKNPYTVWLSEVILQQTRVAQGLPYFSRFIEEFPTVHHLAAAEETEVLKLWQGLGYYTRARNLLETARVISLEKNGVFPDNYKELTRLKGVGDYTASAIGSICFDKPYAVVDGNVFRVLSRIFGIETPVNTSKGKREFKSLAQNLIDPARPGTFNQAVMEFGALQCVPQNPDCETCVFKNSCFAKSKNRVAGFPVKQRAKPVRKRYFNYLVFLNEKEETIFKKRTQRGIWKNLYEFPLIETRETVDLSGLKSHDRFSELTGDKKPVSVSVYNEIPIVHKLSHQHLYTRFWIVETGSRSGDFVPASQLEEYPVPVLIADFISEFFSCQTTASPEAK